MPMMSVRLIIGLVAIALVAACGMSSSLVLFKIVDQVNALLPKDAQFGQLVWYLGKYRRLQREYRRLYPDGGLFRRFWSLVVLMFAFGLVCAWAMRIFSNLTHR